MDVIILLNINHADEQTAKSNKTTVSVFLLSCTNYEQNILVHASYILYDIISGKK